MRQTDIDDMMQMDMKNYMEVGDQPLNEEPIIAFDKDTDINK